MEAGRIKESASKCRGGSLTPSIPRSPSWFSRCWAAFTTTTGGQPDHHIPPPDWESSRHGGGPEESQPSPATVTGVMM